MQRYKEIFDVRQNKSEIRVSVQALPLKLQKNILYLHRPRMHYKIMNKRIEQLNAVPPTVFLSNEDKAITIHGMAPFFTHIGASVRHRIQYDAAKVQDKRQKNKHFWQKCAKFRQKCLKMLSSCFGEFVFSYSAERAFEIFGKVFKGGAGLDSSLGYTYCGVIFPAADVAYILLHSVCIFIIYI